MPTGTKTGKRTKKPSRGDRLTARIPRSVLARWDALAKLNMRDRTAEIRYRMELACDEAGITKVVKG